MRPKTSVCTLTAPVLLPVLACFAMPASAKEQSAPAPQMQPASVADANARIAVVQAHIDAYRSGNIDRFVATFAKDAVVRADGFVAVGHDQIKALYALNFEPGAPSIRVHDSGVAGDIVQVSVGYVFADGQEVCCSLSEYEVTNGKVSFLVSGM